MGFLGAPAMALSKTRPSKHSHSTGETEQENISPTVAGGGGGEEGARLWNGGTETTAARGFEKPGETSFALCT